MISCLLSIPFLINKKNPQAQNILALIITCRPSGRQKLGTKLRDGVINVSVATALFTRYLRVIYAERFFYVIFFVFAGGPTEMQAASI
jgi:hypothetical protein